MKFPTRMIGCALALLGIPLGYFAKTTLLRTTPGMENPAAAVGGAMPSSKSSSANAGTSDKIPQLVTMDTLDSLMAHGDGVSYAALSLWLLDADSAEIAAFWENFQKGDPSDNLINLVFINWTRIDPMSALDAVKGTDNEWRAWWAWAAHDPGTAMAAASPNMRKHVAKGAGEFNPQWVREDFDSIPEDVRMIAIEGIRTWKEDENHAATMDFLVHHGSSPGVLFGAFARKDPWGAYDWLRKNDRLKLPEYGGDWEFSALISEMKGRHPDELERMAAMTPSGIVKRMMEDALFESLLATDPQRALEKAREGKAPLVNANRLAAIGMSLLSTDLEKAFNLGGEILSITNSDKIAPTTVVEWDLGVSNRSNDYSDAKALLDGLLDKDPYRTLDMAALSSVGNRSRTLSNLSYTFAQKDLDAYAAWVNRQPDQNVRTEGSAIVVSQLVEKRRFDEASEWAMSIYDPAADFPNSVMTVLSPWSEEDSTKANTWLETAPISESHRKQINSILESRSR